MGDFGGGVSGGGVLGMDWGGEWEGGREVEAWVGGGMGCGIRDEWLRGYIGGMFGGLGDVLGGGGLEARIGE